MIRACLLSVTLLFAVPASAKSSLPLIQKNYPGNLIFENVRSICSSGSTNENVKRGLAVGFTKRATVEGNLGMAIDRWRELGSTVTAMSGEIDGRPLWLILREGGDERICELFDSDASRDDYLATVGQLQTWVERQWTGADNEMAVANLKPATITSANEVTLAYWPPPDNDVPTGISFQVVRTR